VDGNGIVIEGSSCTGGRAGNAIGRSESKEAKRSNKPSRMTLEQNPARMRGCVLADQAVRQALNLSLPIGGRKGGKEVKRR